MTTSSRSAIKSGSAPGRPDGTQDDAVPFTNDFELANPLKIQISEQEDGAVVAIFKNRYGSHVFSPELGDMLVYPE